MGIFEENPWLLIVLIIITAEIWTASKSVVREVARRLALRSSSSLSRHPR